MANILNSPANEMFDNAKGVLYKPSPMKADIESSPIARAMRLDLDQV